MYHPVLAEIYEEERRRELYADARQWRMFEKHLRKSLQGPGWTVRAMTWLAGRLAVHLARASAALKEIRSAHSREGALRKECETC